MPQTIVRNVEPEEVQTLPKLVHNWTSGFVDAPGVANKLASKAFDQAGCFVAEEDHTLVGCVAVTNLPRKDWLVVRYLTAEHANSRIDIVEKLLSRALDYADSQNPEFVRSTTPSIQPYVEVYKKFSFKPIRRDFRILWNLEHMEASTDGLDLKEVTAPMAGEMSKVFVESLHPYWDWRTKEEGGDEAAARNFREGFKKGERWLYANDGSRTVALYGLTPDYYGRGDARFRGAFVVPEYRGKGYGIMIMNQGIGWAKRLGQSRMTVYTFSYLDSLAPGALLYMKSGGKIESEYLQMQRVVN